MNRSIFVKSLLIILPLLLVGFVISGWVSYSISNKALLNAGKQELNQVADNVYYGLKMYFEGRVKAVEALGKVCIDQFIKQGDVIVDSQKTVQVGAYNLPLLTVGGKRIANDYTFVDNYAQQSGITLSIFQVFNNELIRISTTAKDPQGNRPVGITINSDSSIYQNTINGQSMQTFTELNDKRYIVYSSPFKDKNGKVVGTLLVGVIDVDDKTLFEQVKSIKIGETGYFFVMNKAGKCLVHPKDEAVNADFSKYDFVQYLIKNIDATGKDAYYQYKYEGVNKIVTWRYLKEFDWNIVATVPVNEFMKASKKQLISTLITNILVLLGISLSIMLIMKSITFDINRVKSQMSKLADGDLTQTVETNRIDEIGDLVRNTNAASLKLRNIMKSILDHSNSVAASAEELNASADETSRSIQIVANTIQEVSKGAQTGSTYVDLATKNVNKTTQAIDNVSHEISRVSEFSLHVNNQAIEGNNKAIQAVEKINSVKNTVIVTSTIVQALGEKSKQIGEIVGVITGIASQTNLLALNAAIEAARAGEAGRGFAVVADEVRKLAEDSSQAAENIRKLIKEISIEMDHALNAMAKSTDEVDLGSKVVSEAGESLITIVNEVDQISKRIEGIKTATEGISKSSEEIIASMKQISITTEESAAGSEEASSATEEQTAAVEEISSSATQLAKIADELKNMVNMFKV